MNLSLLFALKQDSKKTSYLYSFSSVSSLIYGRIVWGQEKDGRHRPLNHSHSLSGANKPRVTHGALGPTAFGPWVFKSSVPWTAKITSGKKVCQRSGVTVSVLLNRKNSWLAILQKSLTLIWFISPAIKQLKTMVLPAFSRSETFCWL